MKRITLAALFAVLLAGFAATSASAATNFGNAPNGSHYAKGASEPVCSISGLTVTCTATAIQGVGNTNADVSLIVTSTFTGVCHNPGVNSKVVDPFTRSVNTETTTTLTSSRNGQLRVPEQTATGTSSAEFLADFSCPNASWTPEVTGSTLSYVYTLTFAGYSQPAITVTG